MGLLSSEMLFDTALQAVLLNVVLMSRLAFGLLVRQLDKLEALLLQHINAAMRFFRRGQYRPRAGWQTPFERWCLAGAARGQTATAERDCPTRPRLARGY